MADIDITGDLPSLTTVVLTTSAQSVAIPARARAVYVIEQTPNLQYSFDGSTYADGPNAAGFLVWSRARSSSADPLLYLKLASGTTHTVRLDVRDHL